METGRVTGATTHSRTPMGDSDHGLHHILPKVRRFGIFMVVVDKFSMYATFIPATAGFMEKEANRLFFNKVVKYWGLRDISLEIETPLYWTLLESVGQDT